MLSCEEHYLPIPVHPPTLTLDNVTLLLSYQQVSDKHFVMRNSNNNT